MDVCDDGWWSVIELAVCADRDERGGISINLEIETQVSSGSDRAVVFPLADESMVT